jgi:V8-like Glu-specific endopeptidase
MNKYDVKKWKGIVSKSKQRLIRSIVIGASISAISFSIYSAIYGTMDNIFVEDDANMRSQATGIALMVQPSKVEFNNNSIRVKGAPSHRVNWNTEGTEKQSLCSHEPFYYETVATGETCTAFLVSENQVMTAGHCVYRIAKAESANPWPDAVSETEPDAVSEAKMCQHVSFIFGVTKARADNKGFNISKSDHYKCKKIDKMYLTEGIFDYALITLDRPVKKRHIFSLGDDTNSKIGDSVYTLSHPMGMAVTYSSNAQIKQKYWGTFHTNLDGFGGSSGAPVIDKKSKAVIGVYSGGDGDFKSHSTKLCQVLKYYDDENEELNYQRIIKMSRIQSHIHR